MCVLNISRDFINNDVVIINNDHYIIVMVSFWRHSYTKLLGVAPKEDYNNNKLCPTDYYNDLVIITIHHIAIIATS